MNEFSYKNLNEILERLDLYDELDLDDDKLKEKYKAEFKSEIDLKIKYESKTVLGLDIYEYSMYGLDCQALIPFVFEQLFNHTKEFVIHEDLLFEENTFVNKLILTGDGGYQVFKDPLQALVFNTMFNVFLNMYNSFKLFPKLRNYVGALYLRSCISNDQLIEYSNVADDLNIYGPAIINNARILSKDKLNRFLIDENTYTWFLAKMKGIENITEIKSENIRLLLKMRKYNKSMFFGKQKKFRSYFKSCHIQKIGRVKAKNNEISVYNLEVQVFVCLIKRSNAKRIEGFVTTIGNLNSSDIN